MSLRRRVFLVLLAGILWTAGCKNPAKEPSPPGILNREEFTNLLFDLHLADGWFAIRRAQGDEPKVLATRLYDSVFASHKITREQFEQSMEWYAARPQVLDKIYDELIHRINVLQASPDSLQASPAAASDIENR
ncbi:MAG: DUF4296 domain-containing protein [Bacteroidales bacterium]